MPQYEDKDIDTLLEELRIITEATENDDAEQKVESTFSNLKRLLFMVIDNYDPSNIGKKDKEVLDYYESINTDYPQYGIDTYENFSKKIGISMVKNSTLLFDSVIEDINDDMDSEGTSFDSDAVLNKAIGISAKYCSISKDDSPITKDEFKKLYHKRLFGEKKFCILKASNVVRNYEIAGSAISVINNSLLVFQRIKMSQCKSRLINIIKDKRCILGPTYIDLIKDTIKISIELFKFMRDEYISYQSAVMSSVNKVVSKYKAINESVAIHENFIVDVANIIYPISQSLNETVDSGVIPDAFADDFETKVNNLINESRDKMNSIKSSFNKRMGIVLNSIPNDVDLSNIEIKTYSNLNTPIEDILELFKNQFSDNINYLNNYTEHYNEMDSDITSHIRMLLPESFNECIPSTASNMSELLANIFKKICGTEISIKPNINIIGENIVLIPEFLSLMDSHIESVVNMTTKFSKTVSNEGNISAINSIKNAFVAYLAVILGIYKILSIYENSALTSVTAISDMLDNGEN